MATKFDYAFNPLATSQISFSFSAHQVDDWDYFQDIRPTKILRKTRLEKFGDQMDKMLEKQNVESIKKTMQMHEDVFKHQVKELHRLYNVQKALMGELKKEIKQSSYWSPKLTAAITQTPYGHNNFSIQTLKNQSPNSREQSGSCSFNLEKPAEEVISTGISAIDEDQTRLNSNGYDEDCEIELTLSIGNSLSNKSSKTHKPNRTHIEKMEMDTSECSDSAMIMSSNPSARFDQERDRKHWIFESLKLK